ncbi:site-specific integrase [Mangrovimonas sp. AS39]|uniref:tyrosine-type recombinase/integrase n=1 Tax=Mangrovimonas futianensis TaxID=2895523 RepID=UPI001E3EC116|nr:site-specific integrase [Mangrovimonas futianensis]MCF1190094.1 site-specific integrase [Mangrovimonas futianensis]MCF1194155.1 site-specific integrase [Mangrovimonas futianensis]
MNLKYFIISGKRKYSSIYVRFWDSNRLDQKTKTGLTIEPKDWSSKKQRYKIVATESNVDLFNDKLDKLEKRIFKEYNLAYANSTHISNTWLKEVVSSFFNVVDENQYHKKYFVAWADKFVKSSKDRINNGKRISEKSVKNYSSALNKLKAYEAKFKTKLRFEDIDLDFHQKFVVFCQEEEKLNNNSIGNIITRIKTFCRNIELEQLPINPQYKHREFKAPTNETFDTYLNEEEINKIFKHDFSKNEKLDNARDLFIIGLRTGLRVSDFLSITEKNILNGVINITTKKTNQNLTIPIHPQFEKVLEKRNGKFPRSISDQKFNLYIKDVCEEVGIDEMTFGSLLNPETKRKENKTYEKYKLISSHTCRRSFATNLFLGGVPNEYAMKATGHKSEKQYLAYVKANDEEHLNKLTEYWNKQNN